MIATLVEGTLALSTQVVLFRYMFIPIYVKHKANKYSQMLEETRQLEIDMAIIPKEIESERVFSRPEDPSIIWKDKKSKFHYHDGDGLRKCRANRCINRYSNQDNDKSRPEIVVNPLYRQMGIEVRPRTMSDWESEYNRLPNGGYRRIPDDTSGIGY